MEYYDSISKQLQDSNKHTIIGTDQNADYIKIDTTQILKNVSMFFLSNGFIPTMTKPTRIAHATATLIDTI